MYTHVNSNVVLTRSVTGDGKSAGMPAGPGSFQRHALCLQAARDPVVSRKNTMVIHKGIL